MGKKRKIETLEEFIQRKVVLAKAGKLDDIKKGRRTFDIAKRAYVVETKVGNSPDKIIILDELYFHDNNESRLRFCYYIRRRDRKFGWGQFGIIVSRKDYQRLLKEAAHKGINVPSISNE